jgi:hypothetical protein
LIFLSEKGLRLAHEKRRLVVNFDKGFGELAFRFGLASEGGVILFRLSGADPEIDSGEEIWVVGSPRPWLLLPKSGRGALRTVRLNIKPFIGPARQTAGRLWELGHGIVDVSMRSSVSPTSYTRLLFSFPFPAQSPSSDKCVMQWPLAASVPMCPPPGRPSTAIRSSWWVPPLLFPTAWWTPSMSSPRRRGSTVSVFTRMRAWVDSSCPGQSALNKISPHSISDSPA